MDALQYAINDAMRKTRELAEEKARALGVSIERYAEIEAAEERCDLRRAALERSGIALPREPFEAVVRDTVRATYPVRRVRDWLRARLDRPILILAGDVGLGKTVAAACAVADTGGGYCVHAPELHRRVNPTRMELDGGAVRVNTRAGLLVLDDLGTEEDRSFPRWAESLAILLERRIQTGRTIITVNMRKKQLAQLYGKRITSRLDAHAWTVECEGSESLRATGGLTPAKRGGANAIQAS